MNVVSCPSCGGDIPEPEPDGEPSLSLVCPDCASRVAASVCVDGAETLPQPQLLGEEADAASRPPDPAATVALGSGTARLDPEDAVGSTAPVLTVLRAVLILVDADGSERFAISGASTTVGREDAEIVVPDPTMSGRHFEILARGAEYFVRDLGSSNGTFLNGDRVRAAELVSGCTIRAGQSNFTFRTFEAIALEVDD